MERMAKVVLEATRRSVTGKQVGVLRRQGKLPGVMYGHHFDPTPITLDLHTSTIALSGLSSSSLVYLNLEGSEHAALIREKQRDYIRGTLKHLDFQVVSLTEKIRTKVSIELTGLSPAVKDLNAVIVTGMDQLEVEAFPQDLPEHFVIDISKLAKIGDGIYVRDVPTPQGVVILTNPDEMLAITTYGAGEEVEGVAGATGVEEPEVIEKGKKEEEEEAGKK
jgi:large subunit ribosomal protein L25